ncbi:hypothetical protein JWG42_08705, partial [Desulfoprunum benzoelyticum]|uniref:hypothetical protein n=1 Tax=Desulfoprunum benzoelyticum TaxID=1506996 RepID=UPI001964D6CC
PEHHRHPPTRHDSVGCERVSGSILLHYCRNIFYTDLSNTVLDLFNLNKVASLPVRSCGISEDL